MSEHNRSGNAPAAWAKFDPRLRQAIVSLQADPTIELPVMIVLAAPAELPAAREGPPGREDRAKLATEQEAAFERETDDLVQELEQLGARDLRLFWINQTVSARLTLPALEAAGKREEVKQIVLAVRQKALE
jgi:hypothetical protein